MIYKYKKQKELKFDFFRLNPQLKKDASFLSKEQDLLNRNKLMTIYKTLKKYKISLDEIISSTEEWKPRTFLGKTVNFAGFFYIPSEDIIASKLYNLQRHLGYCRQYDEAAIGMNAVIDAEPVKFEYDGFEWMIEFWKGQYCLETGGEIGIYRRKKDKELTEDETKFGKLYECIPDHEMLHMSFELKRKKNDEVIMSRKSKKHWWLTGFKWGIFAEPEDLVMSIAIELKTNGMTTGFKNAITALGYDINCANNIVKFVFDKPMEQQPKIRETLRDAVQEFNRNFVDGYNALKKSNNIANNDPDLIGDILGSTQSRFEKDMITWMERYFTNRIYLR